jgi:hypothetical protein
MKSVLRKQIPHGQQAPAINLLKVAQMKPLTIFRLSLPKCLPCPKICTVREFASYILWSSVIDYGHYMRPGMLMSKNWMHFIWSWDHCFNAMAASYHLPGVSWDNMMVIFDGQKENGQLPNRYGYATGNTDYRYLKPPIHGWALRKMMENFELTPANCRKFIQG